MSLKSLALLSHKGGVGKTIISVNLAVHLATALAMVFLQEGTVEEIAEKKWYHS